MVVGILFVLEMEPTVADMIEVLEPLKERHSHTSSIAVQIRDYQLVVLEKDPFGFLSYRPVGAFSDYLGLDLKYNTVI